MDRPIFTIITPSLQRESLLRTCQSIDNQTLRSVQHIVMVDAEQWNLSLMAKIQHPQRTLVKCAQKHGHYGNRCRHDAWNYATGVWIWGVDDDNAITDANILEDMATVLADVEHWAVFPIMRHGWYFFNDPPGLCMTDTMNFVVRREIGRWPNIEAREADGHLVESLKAKYPYSAFPNFRAIGIMETSSNGV